MQTTRIIQTGKRVSTEIVIAIAIYNVTFWQACTTLRGIVTNNTNNMFSSVERLPNPTTKTLDPWYIRIATAVVRRNADMPTEKSYSIVAVATATAILRRA